MSTLTLELSPKLLERLQAEAAERRQSVEETAASLLEERLQTPPAGDESEQERVVQALREAGLLRELSDDLRSRIKSDVRHEDVVSALGRAGGKPLSEIIIEQRGPKE